ncbi:MAG: Gfo/Idh/MocA family oxidoreductase [Phycisphaeraceae bacterium]
MQDRTAVSTAFRMKRRHFIKAAAAGSVLAGLPAVSLARSVSANEKVNLACIGIGNQGGGIARTIGRSDLVNVVALCDVDLEHSRTNAVKEAFSGADQFQDFRKMFDQMGDQIDAVTIGTPDHSHFPIGMLAMSMGKHIYVEKPMANTFQESELMMAAEKKYKVAAQVGNQGHSGGNYHQFKAWKEAGVIKDVTKIVAFMNSPRRWHGWTVDGYPTGEEKPDTLDWDLWHTTSAESVPFSGRLHPGNWRSWYRFGNGAFGDWGPHILDTAHRFLELGLPTEIQAIKRDGPNAYIFPQASTIKFTFPARGDMPPVEVFWYDGTANKPEAPPELEGRSLQAQGKLIFGKDLTFYGGTHGAILRIVPESKLREIHADLPEFEVGSSHHQNFILGAKGEEQTRSSLDVAGLLSQVFNLGTIAQELGGTLKFDPATKRFTNNDQANELLAGPPPRKGWEDYYKL